MNKTLTEKDKSLILLKNNVIGMTSMPVTFRKFFTDPYYNKSRGDSLYKFWWDKADELFPNSLTTKSGYLVLTGSIGGGKSFFSICAMEYEIYKMTLIKDPKRFFGIGMDRGVYIKCLNVHKFKAQDVIDALSDDIFGGKVPYFTRAYEDGNWLLRNLKLVPAKNRKDLISDDTALVHLSEISEFPWEIAKKMISDTSSRVWGRFGKGEHLFNLIILDSSSKESDSPVDNFIATDPSAKDAFIVRVNQWDTREGLGFYEDSKWRVAYAGDLVHPPYLILDKEFDTKSEAKEYLKTIIAKDGEDLDRFFYYPSILHNEALRDIDTFIQDKAGISTLSTDRFFKDINRVSDCMTIPMTISPVITLDFDNPYDDLYSKVTKDITFPHDKTLFIGIDAGVSSDCYGIAIGYLDGYKTLGQIDIPNIVIPMAFEVSRYEGQQTPLTRVADFIVRLSDDYDIGVIGYDQYQSMETVQRFTQLGFKTQLIQTTRTDQPYGIFKNRIYQNTVQLPMSDILKKQFGYVKRENGKIVLGHMESGSHCDALDAVCRVINLIDSLGNDVFLSGGRPGGRVADLDDLYSELYDQIQIRNSMNRFGR